MDSMVPLFYCTGQWISEKRHFYYPGFRKDFQFQTATRSINEELPLMAEIGQEERITVALEKSKESGFLGVSLLHRLHKLYNFDVLRDLVFDAMHLVPLNLVKRRLDHLLSNSLVDRERLQEALTQMSWTTGVYHVCFKLFMISKQQIHLCITSSLHDTVNCYLLKQKEPLRFLFNYYYMTIEPSLFEASSHLSNGIHKSCLFDR